MSPGGSSRTTSLDFNMNPTLGAALLLTASLFFCVAASPSHHQTATTITAPISEDDGFLRPKPALTNGFSTLPFNYPSGYRPNTYQVKPTPNPHPLPVSNAETVRPVQLNGNDMRLIIFGNKTQILGGLGGLGGGLGGLGGGLGGLGNFG